MVKHVLAIAFVSFFCLGFGGQPFDGGGFMGCAGEFSGTTQFFGSNMNQWEWRTNSQGQNVLHFIGPSRGMPIEGQIAAGARATGERHGAYDPDNCLCQPHVPYYRYDEFGFPIAIEDFPPGPGDPWVIGIEPPYNHYEGEVPQFQPGVAPDYEHHHCGGKAGVSEIGPRTWGDPFLPPEEDWPVGWWPTCHPFNPFNVWEGNEERAYWVNRKPQRPEMIGRPTWQEVCAREGFYGDLYSGSEQ